MLILLPPSEGKAAPTDLPQDGPLDLGALALPELRLARETMLEALIDASGRQDATALLKVKDTQGDLVAANLDLRTSRTGPAGLVYTGVLYEAAGMAELLADDEAAQRAGAHVLISSALYGMVAPTDLIAPYRMNMDARSPLLDAPPARAWKPALKGALDERVAGDVVVDARSGSYAAAWTPPRSADHIGVRVEREVDGVRSVVSHSAKHLRGVLTGHLLRRSGAVPASAEEVLAAARELLGSQVGTATTPLELIDADLVPATRGADQLVLVTA